MSDSWKDIQAVMRSGVLRAPEIESVPADVLAKEGEGLSHDQYHARYREAVREAAIHFRETVEAHGPEALRGAIEELNQRRQGLKRREREKREEAARILESGMQEVTDDLPGSIPLDKIEDRVQELRRAAALLHLRESVADAVLYQWLAFSTVEIDEIASPSTTREETPSLPDTVKLSKGAREVCETIVQIAEDRGDELLKRMELQDLFQRVGDQLGLNGKSADGRLRQWVRRNLGTIYWEGSPLGIARLARDLLEADRLREVNGALSR